MELHHPHLHAHNLKLRSGNFSIEKSHYENVGFKERLVSMFMGGVLLSRGLKRPFKAPFLYGAYLTYRGITGHCLFYERLGVDGTNPKSINIRGEFEIDKRPEEVYTYWRNLNHLPGSIQHLLNVRVNDGSLARWKSGIMESIFSADPEMEIVKDEPGRLIGWRSSAGSIWEHVGRVTFDESKDGKGTTLKIMLSYHPGGGGVGMALGKIANPYLELILKKEIKSFKYAVEGV